MLLQKTKESAFSMPDNVLDTMYNFAEFQDDSTSQQYIN